MTSVAITFIAAAIGISVVAVGWMRRSLWPMRRHHAPQRKVAERSARKACAPFRPHVEAAPAACPVDERLIDVIRGSQSGSPARDSGAARR